MICLQNIKVFVLDSNFPSVGNQIFLQLQKKQMQLKMGQGFLGGFYVGKIFNSLFYKNFQKNFHNFPIFISKQMNALYMNLFFNAFYDYDKVGTSSTVTSLQKE